MNFYLKNKCIISAYTKEIFNWCNENLVFVNPEYMQKQAMGKWTGDTKKEIVLYEMTAEKLLLPFGVAKEVYLKFKKDFGLVMSMFSEKRDRKYNSNIKLYEYQERAVQKVLKAKNGVLVAPCGSGKTQMGLEVAARIGGKTLWVTHTIDLLQQSMERAKSMFDISSAQYGTITAGKVNIGNTITFATVQTLANIDLKEYENEWDCIIVDECHKAVGTPTQMMMFYKVLSKLSARYKIGLTATPYRADGLEKCMFALLGGKIHEISKSEVKDATCQVEVRLEKTGFKPNLDVVLAGDGTIVYSSLVKNVTEDKERNEKICRCLEGLKSPVLVLSDRVEHLNTLSKKVSQNKNCAVIDGKLQSKSAKEKRKQILKNLNEGKIDIVFATYKLAKEGLDVPNLNFVVFATPIKDKATVIQSAGRVGRKSSKKEYGTVVDFCDDFGMLKGYEKKRISYYKSLGYKICD